MPRSRSPHREKAFELWSDSGGKMRLIDIAAQLSLSHSQIRKWKSQDRWTERLKGNVTESNSNVTKHAGAPRGNRNAIGNIGGIGGPKGNDKAVSHGFFRRVFPDDEETLQLIHEISTKTPLDMLWENIVIQYTAIARAQRLMFVEDVEDHTQVLRRRKDSDTSEEREWEFQFSWDKQANFLQAQSRAIKTLEGLIARYEELLPSGLEVEKRRLQLEKLKAEIATEHARMKAIEASVF